MKGYVYIDFLNKEEIKYIAGKRYHSKNGVYFKKRVKDFDFSIVLNNCYKFYEIKIYKRTTGGMAIDFKIISEVDYTKFLKSSNKKEQILSIYKNHETDVLDKFIKNDDPNKKTIMLESGIHFYLDMLINDKEAEIYDYQKYTIIRKYGRNKDLDYFINDDNFLTRNNVAKIGRTQDLDVLINDCESEVVKEVLSNRRFKDIDKYIDNDIYLRKIINTKIDKYLDFIMKNKEINKFVINLIIDVGRDCDLNEFIKNRESRPEIVENILFHKRKKDFKKYIKSDDFLIKNFLAKYGDDEILDTLVAEDFISTREEIINRKRIKDLEFYLTKKDLYADLFIKIITFKIDELLPLILEKRKNYELYYSKIDDAIYKSYGDKTLSNLFDTTSEDIIKKILELKNEEYINYILDKGNSIQKKFILNEFHNFNHAKKLLFDEDSKVSEKAFSVLMEYGNRELFKEKLNSW